jgi:hypothetical protein
MKALQPWGAVATLRNADTAVATVSFQVLAIQAVMGDLAATVGCFSREHCERG